MVGFNLKERFFLHSDYSQSLYRIKKSRSHSKTMLLLSVASMAIPMVPEAFFYSLFANFATRTTSFIFLLARSAESREKKAWRFD